MSGRRSRGQQEIASHDAQVSCAKFLRRDGNSMKKETFDELVSSIDQGGAIVRGRKAPSRTFRIDNPDVLAIRRHLGLTDLQYVYP